MSSAPRLQDVLSNIQEIVPATESQETRRGKTSTGVGLKPAGFRNIMVAYDASEGALDALAWGRWLARMHDARLFVSLVLPPTPEIWSGALTGVAEDTRETINAILQDDEVFGRKMLKEAQRELDMEGVTCETIMVEGEPKNELPALAEKHDVDLIVMGSHERRGLDRVALGSVSNAVKDRTDASVLIARNAPPLDRVLLAVDGSEHSRHAAATLVGLMDEPSVQAHVVHVHAWPFAGFSARGREKMEKAAPRLKGEAGKEFRDEETNIRYRQLYGRPAQRIVDEARQEKAGLIVMGARGVSPLKGFILGSVSNQVVQDAHTSVLLVRRGARTSSAKAGADKATEQTKRRSLEMRGPR